MVSPEKQSSGMKEVAMLVAVLVTVAIGTVGTYYVRSRGVEAAADATAAATGSTPEAQAPAHVAAPAPMPTSQPKALPVALPMSVDPEVFHADIYFDFKSTRLSADASRLLQERAALMDHASTWVVLVQGYSDSHGPAAYNRTLAERRAETVKQFLVELGVPETSVKVVGIGKEGALCDGPDKACQQLNRRVHLEIRKLTASVAGR